MANDLSCLRIHPIQPVGLYPFPISNLVLPALVTVEGPFEQADEKQQAESIVQKWLLGHGDQIRPSEVPEPWKFYQLALQGHTERAIARLEEQTASDRVALLNRFAMVPSPDGYRMLSAQLTGDAREWLETIAFTAGLIDSVPADTSLPGELSSVSLSAAAAQDIEEGEPAKAVIKLTQAIAACRNTSPCLAAMLLAQRADISQSLPNANMSMVIQDYRDAIQGSQCSLWGTMIAELHVKLGMALQSSAGSNRGALLEAIQAYQHALQYGVDESRHPELFATLQNNLGLAYLAMPQVESSAQLRVGIAVQSFRQALAIFTKETDQDRWASTSMNLANALQYAPTSHPQENLIQAVDLYEDVLSVRTRAKDPVAYALVLLNQANALAHLGIFKPSLEKLSEAYKLFQWYEQTEQAMAARELVDQINQKIAEHHQRDTEPVSHV